MEAIRYLDFDLLIDRFGKKYKARVINSPAGQAASEFDAPFSVGELQEFWSKLESCLQKKAASPSDCKPILKKFGGQLFATVFAGYVRSSFGACLNEASHQGAGLRLRLRLSEAPELAALPWEFLHDPSTNRFLSLSNQTPIVRYLDLPERIKPLAVQPPLRMLVMVASPWDLPPLEVEQEWQNVKNALAEAERKKLVQLECLETATLSTLQKRLREMPFHLFHFIGHGDFDEAAQTGVLYLENEDKKKRAVSGDELGILLHDEETLRMAVLNACQGSRSAGRDHFSGMAQRLVQQGIPAVIAMQAPISDTAALIFSQEFYSALAFGYPVDAAVSEARKAIFSQGNEVEWGTPVLFMRAPDGRIFDMASVHDDDRNAKDEERGAKGEKGETEIANSDKPNESPTAVQQIVTGAGGQVIQAGRDVIMTPASGEEKKDVGKRLSLWLGIVATVVTIITSVLMLPSLWLWRENVTPSGTRYYGVVQDDSSQAVAEATIEIKEASNSTNILGSGYTQSDGEFNIPVKVKPGSTVWVTVSKAGYKDFTGMKSLDGNDEVIISKLRRKP